MFRLSRLPRQTSRPEPSRSALKSFRLADNCGAKSRSGRAFTEVLLIVLVPCFSLMIWALCDSELKKSLLAGPNKDNLLSVNPVYDAVNMENDTVLTVQGQGQLRIWDLKKSVMLGEMQSHLSEVRCADYSPEQRLLAVGSAMGKLEIWDLEHPEMPVLSDDPTLQEVADCLFTPDGKVLLTSGEDGKLVLWNPRTLERLDALVSPDAPESIRSLNISADGNLVIGGTHSGLVQIWDLEQRKLLRTHRVAIQSRRPEAAVETVAFVGDGTNFVSATRNDGVAIWNIKTGACVLRFTGNVLGLRSGLLSHDGSTFTAGSEQGQIVIWDVATGNRIAAPLSRSSIIRSLACSADGKTLLSGDWNGRVQFQHESNRAVTAEIAHR
ncbi:MAG: serine/threonine protein kinase with repeat [Planctomycetaceae bacterium]|nr:serine/threonine protein kinase with repeat [Planctomycetaceae bacterium]